MQSVNMKPVDVSKFFPAAVRAKLAAALAKKAEASDSQTQIEKPKISDFQADAAQKSFNPFRIFDRTVSRRFLIRPENHSKYTEEELEELVPHTLRIFFIEDQVWYLAKDVCSFLGITPDNVSRSLKKLDSCYVRQESLRIESASHVAKKPSIIYKGKLYLLTDHGIYALIQKSRTQYAIEFKQWLHEEVLPCIAKSGIYATDDKIQHMLQNPSEIKICLEQLQNYKEENRKLNKKIKRVEKKKIGYIYVATSDKYRQKNIFKIGCSNNLNERLIQLNTSHHIDDSMYIIKSYSVCDYKIIEKLIHKIFQEYRMSENREFFLIEEHKLIGELNEHVNHE